MDKLLATVPYDDFVQKSVAPSNYWKDPYNLTAYVENAALLPFLNNEREHEHSALFKKNLEYKTKKLKYFEMLRFSPKGTPRRKT